MTELNRRIKIVAITDDIFYGGAVSWSDRVEPFMKKGWKTWAKIIDHGDCTFNGRFAFNNTNEKDHLYIEDNKYRITFLRSAFEECNISPYKRKLRENKRKREEAISLSEITHKIKLISI